VNRPNGLNDEVAMQNQRHEKIWEAPTDAQQVLMRVRFNVFTFSEELI